jgi:hypothetical protein
MAPVSEIVEIKLGRLSDGSIARHERFVVLADDPGRCGLYDKQPDVIAQLAPDEDTGRFEATWDGQWKFGRRVQDA